MSQFQPATLHAIPTPPTLAGQTASVVKARTMIRRTLGKDTKIQTAAQI
jgi:hypothetical protein